MLSNFGGNILTYIIDMLYTIPALLIAFPVHELSHGLTAYALGDDTAKRSGRLTLNPFKHLDIFGTICLVLCRFGWAKPVPVDPRKFKNPRGGMAVVALSGPLSNLILGFLSLFIFRLVYVTNQSFYGTFIGHYVIAPLLTTCAAINVGLCIFNLIPIPPLDGERILVYFLPPSAEEFFERNGRYFQLAILLLLIFPVLTTPLNYAVTNIINNFDRIISHILNYQLQ